MLNEYFVEEDVKITENRLKLLNPNVNIFITPQVVILNALCDPERFENLCKFYREVFGNHLTIENIVYMMKDSINMYSSRWTGLYWSTVKTTTYDNFIKNILPNCKWLVIYRCLLKDNTPKFIRYYNLDEFFESDDKCLIQQ